MPKKQEGSRRGASTVTKEGKIRTVVFLDPDLKRALKHEAVEREVSVSAIVNGALRRHLGLD